MSDETLFDNDYKGKNTLEEKLKLTSKSFINKSCLYTSECAIRKYSTIYQIMDDYYNVRYDMNRETKRLSNEWNTTRDKITWINRMRFINYVIEEKVKVYKCSKQSS